jgi:hypothetical protein
MQPFDADLMGDSVGSPLSDGDVFRQMRRDGDEISRTDAVSQDDGLWGVLFRLAMEFFWAGVWAVGSARRGLWMEVLYSLPWIGPDLLRYHWDQLCRSVLINRLGWGCYFISEFDGRNVGEFDWVNQAVEWIEPYHITVDVDADSDADCFSDCRESAARLGSFYSTAMDSEWPDLMDLELVGDFTEGGGDE